MSRIFDALKKAQGSLSEDMSPLLAEENSVLPEPATETRFEQQPSAPAAPPIASSASTGATPTSVRTMPFRLAPGAPVLSFYNGNSRAGEQYRIVRTKILQHPAQPHILAVSSPAARDGKSVTAVNLAAVLALKDDLNILLVDVDFRRSALAAMLGLPAEPGLAEVLRGACGLADAIVRLEQLPNLYVLPAGKLQSNPAELLDSPGWARACGELRKHFHFLLLDSPPVGGVADYDLIQILCDGLILVVRPDHTDRALCQKALENASKQKLIGVLVNCVDEWFLWKNQHDYYYYDSGREG